MDEDNDKPKNQIIYLPPKPIEKDWLDYAMDITAILATISMIAYMGYEIYIRRKALS